MRTYLAHSSPYRIRLRTPIFANADIKAKAADLLGKYPNVLGVETGSQSLLAHLNGKADMEDICVALEAELPGLAAESSGKVKKAAKERQFWLRSLLVCGIATAGLAVTKWHHAHALAGGVFALLATVHVWERRQRI